MKELHALIDRFEVSRPIFRLTVSAKNDNIEANVGHPIERYRPVADQSNVLDILVVDCYGEYFNISIGEFLIDKNHIAERAMSAIRSNIRMFLERNLEMKNPRQSKLYRWTYRGMPSTIEFNDILVTLYKYIRSFTDEDMRASDGKILHVNNTIALMTAMEEKYSEKD